MESIKPSDLVSTASWASVIVLSWCLALGTVPSSLLTWFIWAFFLVLGICSSAFSYQRGVSGREKNGR